MGGKTHHIFQEKKSFTIEKATYYIERAYRQTDQASRMQHLDLTHCFHIQHINRLKASQLGNYEM